MSVITIVAAFACRGGNSEAEERRYQAARDMFIASLRSHAAALANPVAIDYLNRTAAKDPERESNTIGQFQPQYEEFNRTYCQDMKTIGNTISAGPRSRATERLDEAWRLAEDLVFDAMATALIHSAFALPPDQRLTELGVRSEGALRGTEFHGIAALQESGLLDPSGRFKVPELGTAEYNRYEKWAKDEAEGLAGRINRLLEPTEDKMAECLPPQAPPPG